MSLIQEHAPNLQAMKFTMINETGQATRASHWPVRFGRRTRGGGAMHAKPGWNLLTRGGPGPDPGPLRT